MRKIPALSRPNLIPALSQPRPAGGFLLIEVMLAVAIFAVSVLALAAAVENVLQAQLWKDEDEKVRRFLDGQMAQIEAGQIVLADGETKSKVEGWLPEMAVIARRQQLKLKNEDNKDIPGLYEVTIEATWRSGSSPQSRALIFWYSPRQGI
jgi:hypothetical protein